MLPSPGLHGRRIGYQGLRQQTRNRASVNLSGVLR
jgi:hypothetical protein